MTGNCRENDLMWFISWKTLHHWRINFVCGLIFFHQKLCLAITGHQGWHPFLKDRLLLASHTKFGAKIQTRTDGNHIRLQRAIFAPRIVRIVTSRDCSTSLLQWAVFLLPEGLQKSINTFWIGFLMMKATEIIWKWVRLKQQHLKGILNCFWIK